MPRRGGRVGAALLMALLLSVGLVRAQEAGPSLSWHSEGGTLVVEGASFQSGEQATLAVEVRERPRAARANTATASSRVAGSSVVADAQGRFRGETGIAVPPGARVAAKVQRPSGLGMSAAAEPAWPAVQAPTRLPAAGEAADALPVGLAGAGLLLLGQGRTWWNLASHRASPRASGAPRREPEPALGQQADAPFTDGSTTWINGPYGLQARPNDARFPWEALSG